METSEESVDFVQEFEVLTEGLQSLSSRIEKKLNDFQHFEKQHKELVKSMDVNIAKAKEKIKLDIGGKLFTTSKTTLLSVPGTYFHAMLSSGKWQPDEDGNVVCDTKLTNRSLFY